MWNVLFCIAVVAIVFTVVFMMLNSNSFKQSTAESLSLVPKETEFGTHETLRKDLENDICPTCRQKGTIYEGPSGGASVNFKCKVCGFRFNYLGIVDQFEVLDWGQRPGHEST